MSRLEELLGGPPDGHWKSSGVPRSIFARVRNDEPLFREAVILLLLEIVDALQEKSADSVPAMTVEQARSARVRKAAGTFSVTEDVPGDA